MVFQDAVHAEPKEDILILRKVKDLGDRLRFRVEQSGVLCTRHAVYRPAYSWWPMWLSWKDNHQGRPLVRPAPGSFLGRSGCSCGGPLRGIGRLLSGHCCSGTHVPLLVRLFYRAEGRPRQRQSPDRRCEFRPVTGSNHCRNVVKGCVAESGTHYSNPGDLR